MSKVDDYFERHADSEQFGKQVLYGASVPILAVFLVIVWFFSLPIYLAVSLALLFIMFVWRPIVGRRLEAARHRAAAMRQRTQSR